MGGNGAGQSTSSRAGIGARGDDTAAPSTGRLGQHGSVGGRLGELVWPLFFLLLVASDQLSKALAPKSWVYLDPGAGRLWPGFVSGAFRSSTDGAVLDLAAVGLLVALATLAARRAHRPLTRAGLTVLFAGMSSNLLDRLGLDHLTQGVRGRFVVNWFDVGAWRIYLGNVADCCYVVGCCLLIASACALAARARRLAPVLAFVTEAENAALGNGTVRRDGSGTLTEPIPAERLRSA